MARRRNTGAVWAVLLGLWALAGCKVEGTDGGIDLSNGDDLQDLAEQVADEARNTEICAGMTLEELLEADSFSDECRDALLSFLPDPETSFEARLIAPGGARVDGGTVSVLLQAADDAGEAILAADLSGALEVELVVSGEAQLVAEADLEIALAADLPTDLLSVAVVNDYSASMLDADLDDVEQAERRVFECLPPVHETEVLRFSAEVQTALEFTSDAAEIDAALGPDPDFDRGTTALFDAVGQGAEDLAGRTRPVRVLVLSTDGGENSSMSFDEAQVLSALDDADVFVVAMGALLADVDLMKTLTADNGVFFYTREFNALADAAGPFTESLKELIEVRVPMAEGAEAVRLTHGELMLELELSVEAQ